MTALGITEEDDVRDMNGKMAESTTPTPQLDGGS